MTLTCWGVLTDHYALRGKSLREAKDGIRPFRGGDHGGAEEAGVFRDAIQAEETFGSVFFITPDGKTCRPFSEQRKIQLSFVSLLTRSRCLNP